jgi:hypothetical protein
MSDNAEASAVIDWLLSDDTGESSKCIVSQLVGGGQRTSHPYDPDDLGRCVRLLRLVPSLRGRLPAMACVSRQWAALVGAWDELETTLCAELGGYPARYGSAPKTYALMQRLLR